MRANAQTSLETGQTSISSLRKQGGGGPVYDPDYLLLDDFSINPNSGSLAGRVPQVGPAWQTKGQNAGLMTVSGGKLTQSALGSGAGYAASDFSEAIGEIGCEFTLGSGTQPPVMSIYQPGIFDTPITTLKMVHIYMGMNGLSPQWGNNAYWSDANPVHPFDFPGLSSVFATQPAGDYSLVAKFTGNWMLQELRSSVGTLIAQSQAYEAQMPIIAGNHSFFETFDQQMKYKKVWVKKAKTVPVPAMTILLDTQFTSDNGGFEKSPYNVLGSTTPDPTWSANQLTINVGDYQGSGAAKQVGAIAVGDQFWISLDIPDAEAANTVIALSQAYPALIGPASALVPLTGGNGRWGALVTATAAVASNGVIVVGAATSGAAARQIHAKRAFLVKNPPKAFV